MQNRTRRPSEKRPFLSEKCLDVIQAAGGKRLEIKAKSKLFTQGQIANAIYYLVRGQVHITVISKQGKEGMIGQLSTGDFVGEASLTPQPRYLDSAESFEIAMS